MSSGQKQEVFNHEERVISEDHNRLQAFIAQERNDILRALTQLSYGSDVQPGVSIPASGAAATPLVGMVLDGLDLVVDNPGSVLINPGVLLCWMGTPGNSDDSGTIVVVDAGIQSINILQIATNAAGQPRCDVIECRVKLNGSGEFDEVITQENRDIYNESTEDFDATVVTKTKKAVLEYRVRQGTAGSPPGYAAGWLPLGLAIIQSGATTAQVDFYDVRPLWREMKNSVDGVVPYHPLKNRDGQVDCVHSGTVAAGFVRGYSTVELDGLVLGGALYKNSPVSPADVAGFASTDSGKGAFPGVLFTGDNMLRGATATVTANDLLLVSAWMPDLGGSVYLPRCVRYSEETSPADAPLTPTRRRPFGANGILLATSVSQDALPKHMYGVAKALNATGIHGVLGSGYGVPLAVAAIGADGAEVLHVRQHIPGLAEWRIPTYNSAVGITDFDGGPILGAAYATSYATIDLTGALFNGVRKMHVWGWINLLFGTTTAGFAGGTVNAYLSADSDPTHAGGVYGDILVGYKTFVGVTAAGKLVATFDMVVDLFSALDILGTTPHPYLHFHFFGGETISITTGVYPNRFVMTGVEY